MQISRVELVSRAEVSSLKMCVLLDYRYGTGARTVELCDIILIRPVEFGLLAIQ